MQIMLGIVLSSMPELSLKGACCHSLESLLCPETAMAICDRQSYREIPVGSSCPGGCMEFSCKSARFVLAARDVPKNVTASKLDFQVPYALNEIMSMSPLFWSACKPEFKGSWDAYPRHSLVAKLCRREGSAKHTLRFVSTMKELF